MFEVWGWGGAMLHPDLVWCVGTNVAMVGWVVGQW